MSRKAIVVRANKIPKYSTRKFSLCMFCGRTRSVYKDFNLCRICIRISAHNGELPGVEKS